MHENRHDLCSDTGLTSNMEDYIETIWLLSKEKKVVRVKDIAGSLEIKMPSVTAALNKLKEMELIEYEKYGFIELTEKGKTAAQKVYGRHSCLRDFFHKVLQIDLDQANADACRVEHVLSPDACSRLSSFLDFYSGEQKKESKWVHKLETLMKNK
ncbi:MAG TPA: metal-dependent transcriptional regulator [Spirochaetota bacterium]|nr:metal-dependent transcriptional regulator [Spirochaetota bacterium]HPI90958.1 metal-dependent transcriptional regulator [Spirochaetota bacterium]HPR49864.1 metal-dependent transcriptional regulator [Spirochaetota bacterium]